METEDSRVGTEDFIPWQQDDVIRHSQRLIKSFQHWTGTPLLKAEGTPAELAYALFEADKVIMSHGTETDPVLNYGNRTALNLWEMDWQRFTQTPSRYTAEPMNREERCDCVAAVLRTASLTRTRLLEQAKQQGYISNYQGIRISSTGKRFLVADVIVWDVLDEKNQPCGQAATFSRWEFLESAG